MLNNRETCSQTKISTSQYSTPPFANNAGSSLSTKTHAHAAPHIPLNSVLVRIAPHLLLQPPLRLNSKPRGVEGRKGGADGLTIAPLQTIQKPPGLGQGRGKENGGGSTLEEDASSTCLRWIRWGGGGGCRKVTGGGVAG